MTQEALTPKLYVASRASIPARSAMWRAFRDAGVMNIISTWIDEAGEGETEDLGELWQRVAAEVAGADGLILYAEPDDFPLKGALVEVGMAIAAAKPIVAVLPGVALEKRSMRPVGSWLNHPNVYRAESLNTAIKLISAKALSTTPIQDDEI